jgi:hypothetical protein
MPHGLYTAFYSMCSLANVDPIDVAKTIRGLNPETTLGKLFILTFLIFLHI